MTNDVDYVETQKTTTLYLCLVDYEAAGCAFVGCEDRRNYIYINMRMIRMVGILMCVLYTLCDDHVDDADDDQ